MKDSKCIPPAIRLAVLVGWVAFPAQASVVLNFEDPTIGAQFAGDGVGGTAGPFLIDGASTTFTTRGLVPGGTLSASSFGLGVFTGSGDRDRFSFNIEEGWRISADQGLVFRGVDLGGLQSEETFMIRSNAWIGLQDVAPANPGISFVAATGSFLFTDVGPADNDIFGSIAMTGGVPLPIPAGKNLVFSLRSSTFGPRDDVELSNIILAGVSNGLDFGDAPEPTYPTLLSSGGPRHRILDGYHLGASIDAEIDGQPTSQAGGDGSDEDGVAFTSPLLLNVLPTQTTVEVVASAAGKLDAWIDFNQDGDWRDQGERVLSSRAVDAGPNTIGFTVPTNAELGCLTFSRFRFSSAGGLSIGGIAADGEVEDHTVSILPDDDLDLFNRTISDDAVFTAARSITAGGNFTVFPDLSIVAPARVVLHAGEFVALENGFFVGQDAELAVRVSRTLSCP